MEQIPKNDNQSPLVEIAERVKNIGLPSVDEMRAGLNDVKQEGVERKEETHAMLETYKILYAKWVKGEATDEETAKMLEIQEKLYHP